jgi:hypothetical protein
VKVRKDTTHIANSLDESAMLWHQKLGHLNMASLQELDTMVDGMNLKPCITFVKDASKANIKEHHFPRTEQRGLHNFRRLSTTMCAGQ